MMEGGGGSLEDTSGRENRTKGAWWGGVVCGVDDNRPLNVAGL